jgi:hypothetical protein
VKQGDTHWPCFTPYTLTTSCWLCTTNRKHTTYQPYPLSRAVTIVFTTRQATFVTADFFPPSGMREPSVFCYMYKIFRQVYLKTLMRNLDSTRLTTIWNGKVTNQIVLFQGMLIHQIDVCHSISLIGMQFVRVVSFGSAWLEFLDYLTLEVGTNRTSESVSIQLPACATYKPSCMKLASLWSHEPPVVVAYMALFLSFSIVDPELCLDSMDGQYNKNLFF